MLIIGRQSSIVNATRGFTLIEILISLVLLVIILGAVYSSFFTVQRALERFDEVSLKYQEARTALDMIRREIEGAFLKSSISMDAESNRTAFVIRDRDIFGNPASVLHLAAFTFKGSGLQEVSYYVKEKNNTLVLFKSEALPFMLTAETAENTGAEEQGRGINVEMIEGIVGFSVETRSNGKWVRTWDSNETGQLPEVVRFSIEFDDKGNKIKLTEYARPRFERQL